VIRQAHREQPGLFTWIYAIQAGENGPIKIGIATNPTERLKTLQQGNAADLRGLAAWRAPSCEERQLHREFDYARIRGEWFQPVPELVDLVLRLGYFEDWSA
jgi:hypothetical protein